MKPPPIVYQACETACARFEAAEYNVTPIIELGVLVANADGDADPEEIDALRYLFDALLHRSLGADMVRHLVRSSRAIIQEAGVDARKRLIAEILLDCDAVEAGIIVALAVAFASDGLSDAERSIVEFIAERDRFSPARLERLIAEVGTAVEGAAAAARGT